VDSLECGRCGKVDLRSLVQRASCVIKPWLESGVGTWLPNWKDSRRGAFT
jgi:hypothetical protein